MSLLKRGIKRKRVQDEDNLKTRLQGKLHHEAKEVRQAAKKAKSFDLQKLVKKLKGLRQKDASSPEIHDLEAQLVILKAADHERVGNTALKTKIHKDHLLSTHPDVQAAVESELSAHTLESAPAGSPTAKVHGRLLSSKALASEVASAVQALRALLEPKRADADEDEGEEGETVVEPPRPKKSRLPVAEVGSADDEDNEEEEEELERDDDGQEDEETPEQIDLASEAEGLDEGWESGTVDGASEGPDSDDSDSGSDPAHSRPKADARAPKAKAKTGESTFLPSLAVGFTRGDSDSEISDSEAAAADSSLKKNRRGQRARRAIWEKKFGRNANHVKKQQEEEPRKGARVLEERGPPTALRGEQPRRSGRAAQFDAKKAPSDRGWPRVPPASTMAPPTRFSAQAPPFARAPEKPKPERPMHPSWQAKKKLKEKEGAGIVPAQGTKITF